MDVSMNSLKEAMNTKWAHFGRKKTADTAEKVVEIMNSDRFRRVDDGPLRGT